MPIIPNYYIKGLEYYTTTPLSSTNLPLSLILHFKFYL